MIAPLTIFSDEIIFRPLVASAGSAGDDIPRQRSAGGRKLAARAKRAAHFECQERGISSAARYACPTLLDQKSWGFGGKAPEESIVAASITYFSDACRHLGNPVKASQFRLGSGVHVTRHFPRQRSLTYGTR